jgi:hypothetical protein
MDQLFALGYVSSAAKDFELAWRGMSQGWFPEEKRAEFAVRHFESELERTFGLMSLPVRASWFPVAARRPSEGGPISRPDRLEHVLGIA